MRLGFTLFALACIVFAKDRDWQTGKIADLQANQQPATGKPLNRVIVREAEVRIIGKDYEYLAYDGTSAQTGLLTRTLANRKHGCRFIVNDDVRYAQEKSKIYVLDADGKECKLDILRQERLK
jgi:hypothetical protein